MDEINIEPHVFKIIFNYIDPSRLLKLRLVHKSWSSMIDNSRVWEILFNRLQPLVPQLIKIKFPTRKDKQYKNLSKKELNETFMFYKRLSLPFSNVNHMISTTIQLPLVIKNDHPYFSNYKFDLLGEYFAYVMLKSGEVNMLNINTGKLMMNPIFVDNNEVQSIHNISEVFNEKVGTIEDIKIWLTDFGKTILVINSYNGLVFWNVEESRQYATPQFFPEYFIGPKSISRGFDNDVFIFEYGRHRKLTIYRIELNNQDEIIFAEILNLTFIDDLHYTYQKVHIENQKIMIVYSGEPIEDHDMEEEVFDDDYEIDDTDRSDNSIQFVTIIEFPKLITEPTNIEGTDNNYTTIILRGKSIDPDYLFCSDLKIMFLLYDDEDDDYFRLILFELSGPNNKLVATTMKMYNLPNDIAIEGFNYLGVILDWICIMTRNGNVYLFKLNNVNGLLDLHFDRLPRVKLPLSSSNRAFQNPKLTQINGEPRIIVPDYEKNIHMIRIV